MEKQCDWLSMWNRVSSMAFTGQKYGLIIYAWRSHGLEIALAGRRVWLCGALDGWIAEQIDGQIDRYPIIFCSNLSNFARNHCHMECVSVRKP